MMSLSFFTALELEEDGVRIALTIVDTPGFGDNIDNESACVFLSTAIRAGFGNESSTPVSKK